MLGAGSVPHHRETRQGTVLGGPGHQGTMVHLPGHVGGEDPTSGERD